MLRGTGAAGITILAARFLTTAAARAAGSVRCRRAALKITHR